MPLLGVFLLLLAGTFFGSLMALLLKKPFIGVGASLSFAGGVMLVASFTSLILPGLEVGSFTQVATGIVLGFAFMAILENLLPHEHIFKGVEGPPLQKLNRLYLIVLAIVIHNIPEGLSVGIATAYSLEKGFETAVAMAIQDVPEGLVVSLPLMLIASRPSFPLLIGFLSGLVESLFAVIGFGLFELLKGFLATGLGFGGGAMLYVTVKEVFPEAYSEGRHLQVTVAFLTGLLLMLFLDTAL